MMAKCADCGLSATLTEHGEERLEMGLDIFCPGCNQKTPHEPMETQENWPKAGDHQEKIEIDGQDVWADPEMIPLLKALNDAGLITRSHCSGHGNEHAWVVLRMDNIEDIQIRNNGQYKELILGWNPKPGFARPGDPE